MKFETMEKFMFFPILIIAVISTVLNFLMPAGYRIIFIMPITYMQISYFILFALILNHFKYKLHKIDAKKLDFAIIISFAVIMLMLFEMLWSFQYWFATYNINVMSNKIEQNSLSLDNITYAVNPNYKEMYLDKEFNLNHSTKKNMLFFAMSLYLLYILLDTKYHKHTT